MQGANWLYKCPEDMSILRHNPEQQMVECKLSSTTDQLDIMRN